MPSLEELDRYQEQVTRDPVAARLGFVRGPDHESPHARHQRESLERLEAQHQAAAEGRRARLKPKIDAARRALDAAERLQQAAATRERGAVRAALEAPADDDHAVQAALERAAAARVEATAMQSIVAELAEAVDELESKLED